jgi:hypothetical protein
MPKDYSTQLPNIASTLVDEQSLSDAYQRLYSTLDRSSISSISYSDIKLISVSNPVARAAIELRDRLPARIPTRYQGKRLGTLTIVESYIYPKMSVPLRQSFLIKYSRKGETSNWVATTYRFVALAGQAKTLADERFKEKYPDAVIEPGDLLLGISSAS